MTLPRLGPWLPTGLEYERVYIVWLAREGELPMELLIIVSALVRQKWLCRVQHTKRSQRDGSRTNTLTMTQRNPPSLQPGAFQAMTAQTRSRNQSAGTAHGSMPTAIT